MTHPPIKPYVPLKYGRKPKQEAKPMTSEAAYREELFTEAARAWKARALAAEARVAELEKAVEARLRESYRRGALAMRTSSLRMLECARNIERGNASQVSYNSAESSGQYTPYALVKNQSLPRQPDNEIRKALAALNKPEDG